MLSSLQRLMQVALIFAWIFLAVHGRPMFQQQQESSASPGGGVENDVLINAQSKGRFFTSQTDKDESSSSPAPFEVTEDGHDPRVGFHGLSANEKAYLDKMLNDKSNYIVLDAEDEGIRIPRPVNMKDMAILQAARKNPKIQSLLKEIQAVQLDFLKKYGHSHERRRGL